MQRTEQIESSKLDLLVDAIFDGSPDVYESDSKFDKDLIKFSTPSALKAYIGSETSSGERFVGIAIHYPETNGFIEKKKISLIPEKCNGATKQFQLNGWGLIHCQLDYKNTIKPKCRIVVNTLERATAWSDTYPELKSPDLWDWKVVEKNARRLIRVLEKCA